MKETMMTYVHEEEAVCHNILSSYPENVDQLTSVIPHDSINWTILATGSSANAIQSAKYYMEKVAHIHVSIVEPFNFYHYEKMNPTTDAFIAISQSGKSASTIEALKKVQTETEKAKVIFTANIESPISQYGNAVIDIGCGEEKVGFVTKGFTATVLTLMLSSIRFAAVSGRISHEAENRYIDRINHAISYIPKVIQQTEDFYEKYKDELTNGVKYSAIGYGSTFGTAKEFETKFTETVRLPSQGYELEAFMHGPYLEVNNMHRIFYIETKSSLKDRLSALREYLGITVPYSYTITTEAFKGERILALEAEDVNELEAPLLLTIPFQILSHHIAEGQGIDLGVRIFDDFDQILKSKI